MQDLSKINFKMCPPCSELKEIIQTIWFASTDKNLEEELKFKVLTDCASGLVFNFGDEIVHEIKDNQIALKHECLILGPSKHLLTFKFLGRVSVIGIRFFPETGYFFFDKSMDLLKDQMILCSSTKFDDYQDLYQKLQNVKSENEAIELIEEFFLKVYRNKLSKEKPIISDILKYIKSNSNIELNTVLNQFGLSNRELQRLFKTYIGIHPNVLIRVLKMTAIKEQIKSESFKSLTELSYENGFYDQAHFNREFKTFMEETPKKYRSLKKEKN